MRDATMVLLHLAREHDEERRALLEACLRSDGNAVFRQGRSRSTAKPLPRIKRPLSKSDTAIAIELASKRPVRRAVDRNELLAVWWLELCNPTARVAKNEVGLPLERLVEKAMQRAYAKLRPKKNDDNTNLVADRLLTG